MSEVKVNKISPRTGTTFTVGDSGDTITTAGDISANGVTATGTIAANILNATTSINLNGESITALANPTFTSISPDTITNDQTSITITGTNFVNGANVEAVGTNGAIVQADTVSFTNATTLVANFTITTDGTYFIRIENPDGLAVRSSTAVLTVSDAPTWTTAAGSLGSVADGTPVDFTVAATSDSAITYSETTAVLTSNANTPAGTMNLSLNSSTGAITGTAPQPASGTTYNFTLRATDAEGQTADRAFSITVTTGIGFGGQFN